mgnify:CR=1 FL=1
MRLFTTSDRESARDPVGASSTEPHGVAVVVALLVVALVAAVVTGGDLLVVGVVSVIAIGVARADMVRQAFEAAARLARGGRTALLGRPALLAIAAVGVALRLRAFLVDRALWLDEAALARSFLERDLLQLLAYPLMEDQSAPPGFIVGVHALVRVLGFDETTLRLLPLLASVMTVLLAVLVAEGAFRTRAGRALFVGLVALSPILIYYAQEHKQYALDGLAAVSLLLIRDRGWIDRYPWRTGLTLAVVAFFSLPGAILVGVLVGLQALESPRLSDLRRMVPPGLLALTGIAAHLAYTLRSGTDRGRMVRLWTNAGAFPPDAGLVEQLDWLAGKFLEISWVGLAHGDIGGSRVGVTYPLLVLPFLALLLIALRRLGYTARFAILVLLTAVLLAYLTLYPIASRLSLHLVPALAFLAVMGFEQVAARLRASTDVPVPATLVLAMTVLLLPVSTAIDRVIAPRDTMDIRQAVAVVGEGHRSGDVVISNEFSRLAWDVYVDSELLSPTFRVDWDADAGGTAETVGALLAQYAPVGAEREALPRRFWFFAPHRASQLRSAMLAVADDNGMTVVCDVLDHGLFIGVLSEEVEAPDPELCGAS